MQHYFAELGAVKLVIPPCDTAPPPIGNFDDNGKAWLCAALAEHNTKGFLYCNIANITSLLEIVWLKGLELYTWLKSVLTRLPEWPEERWHELLPCPENTFTD